ncbi:hypothetical protein FH972_026452 [Carpinus fangiana]|uniref:DUF7907 domain-containing protein n=1 Tax=Carpinus fangiana TaxID=176857 RepID=A0A5N6L4D6_9ROSI|nr:hypothetical protein FH972_026452 [Carpinus fangiana]
MYTTIALTSALAALSAAAPAPVASAAPKDLFHLKTVPHNPARTAFSQYLTSFHVGAGQSTIVGTKDASKASSFFIDVAAGHYLHEDTGRTDIPTFDVGLKKQAPYQSNAPAGYNYISLDLGAAGTADATNGWVKIPNPDGKGEVVVYSGPSPFENNPEVKSFALCHVNGTSPYPTLGPQYQFLWEAPTTKPQYANCADVTLQAVPVKK